MYYVVNPDGTGDPTGPYSEDELRSLIKSASISKLHLVAKDGGSKWETIEDFLSTREKPAGIRLPSLPIPIAEKIEEGGGSISSDASPEDKSAQAPSLISRHLALGICAFIICAAVSFKIFKSDTSGSGTNFDSIGFSKTETFKASDLILDDDPMPYRKFIEISSHQNGTVPQSVFVYLAIARLSSMSLFYSKPGSIDALVKQRTAQTAVIHFGLAKAIIDASRNSEDWPQIQFIISEHDRICGQTMEEAYARANNAILPETRRIMSKSLTNCARAARASGLYTPRLEIVDN